MAGNILFWILILMAGVLLSFVFILIAMRINLKKKGKEYEEKIKQFESMVLERTRNLEKIRDTLSEYAVQKFELAQELEEKNDEINRQKDDLMKKSDSLKTALDEIKKLDNFRQKMTRMIIHDLKNPLNVILNVTDKLKTRSEDAGIIRKLSWEMLDLILNILEVNKLESSNMKISLESIDLHLLIRKLYEKYTITLINSSVVLKTELPDSCFIFTDEKLTIRVFDNLISNALKFTSPGGIISISAVEDNDMIRTEVKDTGIGIPQTIVNEVFDEYVQGENIPGAYSGSTGIGLAYCKLAVEASGGEIGISSVSGTGTTVWFTLRKGIPADAVKTASGEVALPMANLSSDLEKEDIPLVRPYLNELKAVGIYEVSTILKILHNEAFGSNERLQRWRDELEKAAYKADEEYFNKLLDVVDTGL
jgi:signal transduction histidine kinase